MTVRELIKTLLSEPRNMDRELWVACYHDNGTSDVLTPLYGMNDGRFFDYDEAVRDKRPVVLFGFKGAAK